MPELPEVEILVRHLSPLLKGRTIRKVRVYRPKVIRPTPERELIRALRGAKFETVKRRGKYLLFALKQPGGKRLLLVGHLGMTGRYYLLPKKARLPTHAAVVMDLGRQNLVYEDTRYFGRLTLDAGALEKLGPEPLEDEFTAAYLAASLQCSRQAVKVKLLDQTLVAGVGNIYASEALFRAGISPRVRADKLKHGQVKALWRAVREVLARAIRFGSTLPLDFAGREGRNGLFYYGQAGNASGFYQERLQVYDRQGKACARCREPIKKMTQAARSTYYCVACQRG